MVDASIVYFDNGAEFIIVDERKEFNGKSLIIDKYARKTYIQRDIRDLVIRGILDRNNIADIINNKRHDKSMYITGKSKRLVSPSIKLVVGG